MRPGNQNPFQNSFMNKLIPFVGMGIFIVIILFAIMFFSTIFIIGGIIGLIFFAIAYVKARFFQKHGKDIAIHNQNKPSGKVYDQKD